MSKAIRIAAGLLDILFFFIGVFVITVLFGHWFFDRQLVICYGKAPHCDEYIALHGDSNGK